MKTFFKILVVLFILVSCASQKNHLKFTESNTGIENDSTEYELIVFEPKFETWYVFQNSPAKFRSNEYYENWNKQYVLAWNSKAMTSRHNDFFETIVGYEYGIEYGFELNHKLFHYFMFVENVLKVPVLTNGPHFLN